MTKDAGEFSQWLSSFLSTMEGASPGEVPCGDCIGCCTSSKFILVRPTDSEAKSKIPKELLFPVPGLPKGFLLMGYDEQGNCPMFKEGRCSIYNSRPETCRQYDCRALAATEAETIEESETIKNRIDAWEFHFASHDSEEQAIAVKKAMSFLKKHSEGFPKGYLPNSETQLAAMAVRIYREFMGAIDDDVDAKIDAITKEYSVG